MAAGVGLIASFWIWITVGGQPQPSLSDGGELAALAGQALHLTSRP